MRVLLIKTSSMGDVIHTLPALTDAQRAIPGIRFDWVVEEGFAEIPTWHPAVDQVIPLALRRWRKNLRAAWRSGEFGAFRQRLREGQYDLCIDAQGLLKSAVFSPYVNAPVAGLDRASAREPLASLFYQHRFSVAWRQHAVERVRQLFAHSLGYTLPDGLGEYGVQLPPPLASIGPAASLLFLHSTTWPTKHWPVDYWRQLAMLAAPRQVLLAWGNAAEQARAELIAEALDNVQVLPKQSLAGITGVLQQVQACVAVDTGLGHLAAALGVPTVALFGPTDPGLSGNYGQEQVHLRSSYPCAPCLQERCHQPAPKLGNPPCFAELSPGKVWAALQPLLRGRSG